MNNYSYLPTDFFKYALALIKQNEYNRHPEFSPNLSEEEVDLLKNSIYFNQKDLLEILNTLILNYINLEDVLDDQLDRRKTNNTTVPNTQL